MTFSDDDLAFARNIKAAVNLKGEDYVYPNSDPMRGQSCTYLEKNTYGERVPSCIVGHGLFPLWGADQLHQEEGGSATMLMAAEFDDAVTEGANAAQNLQDNGKTWGEAWAEFVQVVKNESGRNIEDYL